MIYLQRELEEFARTKEEFEEKYTELLQIMHDTFKEKGKTRDIGSPLHHRQSPIGMLSLAQAKCRRIQALLSLGERPWTGKHLADIIEECVDSANYVLYIAALCRMLRVEGQK